MGLGKHSSVVHLLDFGLVRPYMNPETSEHIPFVDNLEQVGTARYASYGMLLGQGKLAAILTALHSLTNDQWSRNQPARRH
jgi:hypothetical protein